MPLQRILATDDKGAEEILIRDNLVPWVLFGAVLCTSLVASACEKQPIREQALLQAEHLWVAALDKQDAKALSCILADEFVDSTTDGGLRNRAQAIDALSHRRPLTQNLQDLKTEVLGQTGIVHGVNHLSDAAGKEVAKVRFTDVFVYRQGRWQAVSAQETLVRETASSNR